MDVGSIVTNSSVNSLHKTIKEQIDATNRQSKAMSALTWAAVVLAFVQAVSAVVQVWLAFR